MNKNTHLGYKRLQNDDLVPQSKKRPTDFYILKTRAQNGDRKAQYNLGVRYINNQNIPELEQEDLTQKAIKWLKKSAAQGYVHAQFNLGLYYEEGAFLPKSIENACKWYALAASQEDKEAYQRLRRLIETRVQRAEESNILYSVIGQFFANKKINKFFWGTFLENLKSHPQITTLNLENYTLDIIDFYLLYQSLKERNVITKLRLRYAQEPVGLQILTKMMTDSQIALTHLTLFARERCKYDMAAFVHAIKKNTTLTFLSLMGTQSYSVLKLTQALKCHLGIESLSVGKLQPGGAKHLGALLRSNTPLKSLSIGNTTGAGISDIATALKVNKTLTSLSLGGTEGRGISAIAEALKKNKTLTSLTFRGTEEWDIVPIIEVLKKKNTTLESLSLREIREKGIASIFIALEENKTLTSLKRADIEECVEFITYFLKKNRFNDSFFCLPVKINENLTSLSVVATGSGYICHITNSLKENTALESLSRKKLYAGDLNKLIDQISHQRLKTLDLQDIFVPGAQEPSVIEKLIGAFEQNMTVTSLSLLDSSTISQDPTSPQQQLRGLSLRLEGEPKNTQSSQPDQGASSSQQESSTDKECVQAHNSNQDSAGLRHRKGKQNT